MLKNAGQSILVIDKNIHALAKLANHHCILEKGVSSGRETAPS